MNEEEDEIDEMPKQVVLSMQKQGSIRFNSIISPMCFLNPA
jgi:hypothetical protein